MNIKFYMSDVIGPGLIRGDIPAKYINRLGADIRVDCKMDIMESDFAGTQIMVFQRAEQPAQLNRMLRAKRQGIKCIYDIDDDLFNVPACLGKIADKYNTPAVRDAMLALHRNADAIFASSKDMAELTAKRAPNIPIYIIPNATDFELSEDAYWNAKPHDGVVIGWHGSWSHIDDVPLIRDAISEVMARYENVKFKIMGAVNKEHFKGALFPFGDRVIELPWVNFYRLPYELAECDIGLCPLLDVQFNRVRSTMKVQEYSAVGVPVVCSPLPCYKEEIDEGAGMIAAPESTDSWIKALSKLVEDVEFRRGMGQAARKASMKKHDIRNESLKWIEAYRQVARLP